MQVIVTAVGPDNRGLADPIVHHVTSAGANIAEIQMYDHDEERIFAMLVRMEWPAARSPVAELRETMLRIGAEKGLSIRVWARDEHRRPKRLALCVTQRSEPPLAVLRAIRDHRLPAEAVVMIGNRTTCRAIAEQFEVPWESIGDEEGRPDNDRFVELLDRYEVDFVILARYMRILPAAVCWRFAGGRVLNLHHGLLPAFPGPNPYRDAFGHRMLTYGATVHFIVPELDAGDQIVHQDTFTVAPGTSLDEIVRIGNGDLEPQVLVEGVRRAVAGEVELHFNKVVRVAVL